MSSTPSTHDVTAQAITPLQREFLSWKFGLFLHFNMATYTGWEAAHGYEDPALFKPEQLDCRQWAEAALAAGMRYGVFTAKHLEGYCLWPSASTTHDIERLRNFRNGRGDLVREYVEAFRSRGLKAGLYYCFPGNFTWRTDLGPPPPAGQPNLFGLPPEARGDFPGFIQRQMTELLTQYGPIDLIWADGYTAMLTPAEWQSIKSHIKQLQPGCVVLANNSKSFEESDICGFELPLSRGKYPFPPPAHLTPAEVCDILDKRGWFWKGPAREEDLLSAAEVVERLSLCNEHRSNYLLNVQPDPQGLISGLHLQRMREIGERLGACQR